MDTPTKLSWPQDLDGMTSNLKREGCRSIGRMNGKEKNLDVIMGVLRTLAQHAKAKFATQQNRKQARETAHMVDRAKAEEEVRVSITAQEQALRNQAVSIATRLAALHKRQAEAEARAAERTKRREAGEETPVVEDLRVEQGIGSPTSG